MNTLKNLSRSLLATGVLIGCASPAWAQVPMASEFAILGGTAVTCTGGSVVGDVGISPGITASFTNTGCTIAGGTPPATNQAAAQARADLYNGYTVLQSKSCTENLAGSLAGQNVAPGVYCVDAVAKTGLLTLTGPSDGVWIFLVEGALTGTNFSVEMAGGGQPCNVYWVPKVAATMTTSSLKGRIFAGDAVLGSITFTGGILAGQALANVAVTTTGTSVIGCHALQLSQ